MLKTQLINEFLEIHFSGCFGAIVTGSVVSGEMAEGSDIDLMVFETYLSRPYEEIFDFKKFQFHVVVTPVYLIEDWLKKDIQKKDGLFIALIANGKVIKDHDKFFENIIRKVQELYSNPSTFLEADNHKKELFTIQKLLIQLKALTDDGETIFCMLELIKKTVKYHLLTNDHWQGSIGKHSARAFKKVNPLLHGRLILGYKEYVINNDKLLFIDTINAFLKSNGVLATNYARKKETIENTCCDYLSVVFRGISFPDTFYNKFLPEFTNLTNGILYPSELYAFKQFDHTRKNEVYYIRVKKDKNVINGRLLPRLRQAYFGKRINYNDDKIYINYSFNLPPADSFQIQTYFEDLKEILFAELQEYTSKSGYNSNQISFHAIYLLVVYGLTLFSSFDVYKSFLNKLCELWLSKAHIFEPNGENSKEKALKILSDYKKKYDTSSREKFDPFFLPLIDSWKNDISIPQYPKVVEKLKELVGVNEAMDFNSQMNIIPYCDRIDTGDLYTNMILIDKILNVFGVPETSKSYIIFNVKEVFHSFLSQEKSLQ